MDDRELRELADAIGALLRPHLERSEPLRRAVGLIGRWCLEQSARPGAPAATERASSVPTGDSVSTEQPAAAVRATAPIPARQVAQTSTGIVPLKIGDAVVHVTTVGTTAEIGRARQSAASVWAEPAPDPDVAREHPELDLALVERRCRLKAESCLFFIRKRSTTFDPALDYQMRQQLNQMVAQAKTMTDCFLWVFWKERTQPDDGQLAVIAECYEALADAAALTLKATDAASPAATPTIAEAFQLLAEATSALRVALEGTWLTDADHDQIDAHLWLRRQTAERRVFVERFMTVEDRAEPAAASDLRGRVAALRRGIDAQAEEARRIRNTLGQIRYHAGQVIKKSPMEAAHDWAKMEDAVEKLAGLGVPATDPRITQAVGAAAAAQWSAETGDHARLAAVIDTIREAQDSIQPVSPEESTRSWSENVLRVRTWLRGQRMVLIGGERRSDAVERAAEAFELAGVDWAPLNEHGPGTPMRAMIQRPETAVVVVIIKLTGHLHADEAKDYSVAAGKPCVFLTGGYNPEQVANAIIEQASERLQTAVAAQ